jgi:MFS family permease
MIANGTPPTRTAAGGVFDARAARAVLMVLAGMALMVTYVETMVLPAFKQFYTFFDGAPYTTIAWILSAYLLVGTVATPIFGKLGDKYGKRRMLLVVMVIYAAAVSLAGFTPNLGDALGVDRANQIYVLIGVRAVQGIGMAMFPLAFAMIPEVFPAARVGQAQGIVSAMFAGGAALGLAGGGWVAQQYGWQLTYHTVIPVAILLVVLAYLVIRESPHREAKPIDLPGVASLGFALAMFMFGLTEGSVWGWTSFSAVQVGALPWGVPEFFLLAALGAVFFLLWEPRAKFPIVSFAALKQRNIWVSNVNAVFVGIAMFLFFVTLVLLTENPFSPGFGLSEFQFGLVALPSAVSMLAFGPFIGRTVSRVGPKPVMLAGFAVMGIGATGLAFVHGSIYTTVVFTIPAMVGNVAVLIAMSNVIVLSVSPRELGIQTGMNQTFRNLGSAIGPVIATTLVASFLTPYLVAPGHSVNGPSNTGYVFVFGLAAAVSIIGFVLSLTLRNFRYSAEGIRDDAPSARAGPTPVGRPEETPALSASPGR